MAVALPGCEVHPSRYMLAMLLNLPVPFNDQDMLGS